MKKGSLLGIFMMLVSMMSVQSQTYHQPNPAEIGTLLQNQRCEVQVRFFVDSKDRVNYFSRKYSVDKVKQLAENSYEVLAYLNNRGLQNMLNEQVSFQIKDSNPAAKAFTMATTVAQMANWDRYPTYTVFTQMMAQFQSTYPTLCRIDTILASTPGGRKILVAKISKNVNVNEDEPEFLYSSTMHGDETTGGILLLRLASYLLSNYGTVPRVTNLLDNMEIYLCPFANPDGTYATSNNTIGSSPTSTRANSNNVDLNRNYPDPWTGPHPDGEVWQPETQAFMAFASAHNFVMSGSFHGGAELMNYPWDYYTTSGRVQPDASWWLYVSKEYADSCKSAASNNGYFTDVQYSGMYPGVTEGADWYIVEGGRQDYMNYWHHCREVTVECSLDKTLGTENLNTYWNYNFKSLLQYMEQALYGIRGVVTDATTGLPLKAKVFVNSHDADSTDVYSSLPVGNYHRPIKGGTYSVTYSAPCYQAQTHTITVGDKQSFRKDIQLVPGLDAYFSVSDSITCNPTVNFLNATDSTATGNTWTWSFGDGSTSTQSSPTHTYATEGTYTVRLIATNSCAQKDTIIKTNYIQIQQPELPVVTNGERCNPGTVNLQATASGTIRWYDLSTAGTLLATGNSYTTPLISTNQTYYVENWDVADSITGGDSRINSGGGFYNNNSEYGLYFDAVKPFKLLSVLVNANSAASRTFKLYNSIGTVIDQITVSLSIGQTRVYLDFDVPQGTGYKITANTTPNLYRNNTTASYPYLIGDLVRITGSNAATNPSTVYYFFYDWHVQEVGCTSTRVPVTATITNTPAPDAQFTQIQSGALGAIFTNTSTNANSYLWNFGDGTTSVEQNPTHQYAQTGQYSVQLIAFNDCSSDTTSQQLTILGDGVSEPTSTPLVLSFPSPAQEVLYLQSEGVKLNNCTYSLYNNIGQQVQYGNLELTDGQGVAKIGLQNITSGYYLLKLSQFDKPIKVVVKKN